ncbi:hypothetical protein [Acidiphilium acidophilum]|uniref:hypothetical protein n=1 Tax=Acidiphilium acidophilum TaxID=76588 RepID=UPI002E8E721F|nr:hypothetical protein [Acidiphilium acidophilum]
MNAHSPLTKILTLDHRAIAYLRDQLALDSHFCRTLAASVDLTTGTCATLLPRSTPTERAYDFTSGNLLPENIAHPVPPHGGLIPVATLLDQQTARIHDHLQSHPAACCLIDDAAAHPSDPTLRTVANALALDNEIFYLLSHAAPPEAIRATLARGNHLWHGLAILCRPAHPIEPQTMPPQAILYRAFAHITELETTAYDGEGFLFWQPPQPRNGTPAP